MVTLTTTNGISGTWGGYCPQPRKRTYTITVEESDWPYTDVIRERPCLLEGLFRNNPNGIAMISCPCPRCSPLS